MYSPNLSPWPASPELPWWYLETGHLLRKRGGGGGYQMGISHFLCPPLVDSVHPPPPLLGRRKNSPVIIHNCKVHILLRRKKVVLGPGVGLAPQRHYFALGIPTCWYLKMLVVSENAKICVSPDAKPNASQWNIGCVGSLALGLCIGHVPFIFFVLISFALGSRRKCSFQWNMGLKLARLCVRSSKGF